MSNNTDILENKFETLFNLAKKSFEEVMLKAIGVAVTSNSEVGIKTNEDRLSLCIIIGLLGNVNGRILLRTSFEYSHNIALAMNGRNALDKEDDLYIYLADFADMFCNIAAKHIHNTFGERKVWMSPPAIFSAKDLDIVTPNASSMKAYYECESDKFVVDIGFNENTYDDF